MSTPWAPSLEWAISRSTMLPSRSVATVVAAYVRPDARVPRGDAGHVPEAARCEPEQRPVLLAAGVGQAHEGRSREVWHVRHDRHQDIVAVGGQGNHVGAQ